MRVGEKTKTLGVMKFMFNVRNVRSSVKMDMYEKGVVPTMM